MKSLAAKGLCLCVLVLTGCGDGEDVPSVTIIGNLDSGLEDLTVNREGGEDPVMTSPVMVNDDAFEPLRPLLGTVDFRYSFFFENNERVFSDTVIFTTENMLVTDEGLPFLGALDVDGGVTVCVAAQEAGFSYACLSEDTITISAPGSRDYFIFPEVVSGAAIGNYIFCVGNGTDCDDPSTQELIEDPDGPVNVIVSGLPVSSAVAVEGEVSSRSRHANEDEFKLYYKSISAKNPVQADSDTEKSADIRNATAALNDFMQNSDIVR
ncbi:MAG: hypothetical protein AB8B97_09420 [Granulosicoccus sp.]